MNNSASSLSASQKYARIVLAVAGAAFLAAAWLAAPRFGEERASFTILAFAAMLGVGWGALAGYFGFRSALGRPDGSPSAVALAAGWFFTGVPVLGLVNAVVLWGWYSPMASMTATEVLGCLAGWSFYPFVLDAVRRHLAPEMQLARKPALWLAAGIGAPLALVLAAGYLFKALAEAAS